MNATQTGWAKAGDYSDTAQATHRERAEKLATDYKILAGGPLAGRALAKYEAFTNRIGYDPLA